jgi:hypothetical protein
MWASYLRRKEHPVWEGIPKADFATKGPFVETRPTRGQVLATHVLPLAAGTAFVPAFLPPSKGTDCPAIQLNSHGKGKVVYFSFDFFRLWYPEAGPGRHKRPFRLRWPKPFFCALLQQLLPSPKIRTELPSPGAPTVSYFHRKAGTLLIIHRVNDSVIKLEGQVVRVDGGTIVINGEFFRPVRAQVVYPEELELRIRKTGDAYEIATPTVDIHSVITVEGE